MAPRPDAAKRSLDIAGQVQAPNVVRRTGVDHVIDCCERGVKRKRLNPLCPERRFGTFGDIETAPPSSLSPPILSLDVTGAAQFSVGHVASMMPVLFRRGECATSDASNV